MFYRCAFVGHYINLDIPLLNGYGAYYAVIYIRIHAFHSHKPSAVSNNLYHIQLFATSTVI